MSKESQQDISRQTPEHAKTAGKESARSMPRIESLLDQTETILGEALDDTSDRGTQLSEAAWHLTHAQWSLTRHEISRRQWSRQAAILLAVAATAVYLTYRLIWTMNMASPSSAAFSVLLLAAEFYAGALLGLYFFQVWRLVDPPLRQPTTGRTVDVFVTTYNEDVSLLRGTLTSCVEMDYPHITHVLDDGARDEVRQLAESLGVRYISRTDREHAKAGNLNNALRQTDGEFVIIFDADHVPYRHYITRLIGYFDDPRMGFVQAPHTTYNLDNFIGRWKSAAKDYWEDVRIFFEAVQLGKNRYGVACFCGSAAIFRRKALEEVGLLATETITEDMHTGMRINAAGWKSIAVGEEMVVGLAPGDAATFASQRLRWGEGNMSVLAYDNPLTMKGLTLAGRINYLASIGCWTSGTARLILYLTPLVMLLTGIPPVADMSMIYFVVVGCYLFTVWTAVKMASNKCGKLLGIELAMMASFHLQIQALWRALFRRSRQKFVVTDKRRSSKPARSFRMWPQMLLIGVSIVAVTWAVSRIIFGISGDYLGLIIGTALAVYHSGLALTVLGRAMDKRTSEDPWRHPLCMAVDCATEDGVKSAISIECNENGCRLLAWKPLDGESLLQFTYNTPVGTTVCHGRIAASTPLGRHTPFAYLYTIVFEHEDPSQRERECDSLRGLIFSYVVPVVTMAHRLVRQGSRTSPEELSGEGDFPIPVTIDAKLPNIPAQKSVALSIGKRGFLATLETPCPEGDVVQVAMDTPLGPIVTEAEVHDVETVRVGDSIIQQHDFRWRDNKSVGRLISNKRRWKNALARSVSSLRKRRLPALPMAAMQLAAVLLVVVTLFVFSQAYLSDRALIAVAHQAATPAERNKVEAALERLATLPNPSTGRLSRIYEAADAIGDHELAADTAKRLAERVEESRFEWMLTSARQLAQTNGHRAADEAFDNLINEHMDRELTLEEQATVYVEAARAAVAVNDLDKAAGRFLAASNLSTTNEEQAEELLGVLIAAKRTKLAISVLEQLDRSDRVLRQIVDVYEMAKQPEAAMPQLEELLRRYPEDAYVVRRLAEIAVAQRDFAAGVAYYKTLHSLEPQDKEFTAKLAETLILLARQKEAAGQFESALALFGESFRLQPPADEIKREYSGLLANHGRFDEAVSILEQLKDTDSQIQLAAVYEMEGNTDRALQVLLDLEKTRPIPEQAQRSIARLLLANKEYPEAAGRLAELLKKYSADPKLQREFIDAVAASGRWSKPVRLAMVNVYEQYLTDDFQSLNVEGFERLSDALRQLGLYQEAGVALDKAVVEFPKSRRLRFYLAQTLGNLGRYNDAEEQYKILLATRSPNLR